MVSKEKTKLAVSQLKKIKKLIPKDAPRLAAEGWKNDYELLISTILSAQTRDEVTIDICENKLFKKYNSLEKLSRSKISDVEKIIRPINYHKTKARNIINASKMIVENFNGKVPHDLDKLLLLPGVGRKVGNVFLVEAIKANAIGVDTHVSRISRKMRWTKNTNPHKIEKDLEKLFPKKYWNSINYILVRFGRTIGRNRKKEDEIVNNLKY